MRTVIAAVAALAAVSAFSPASAGVGFQHLTIEDPGKAPVEVGIWYPTDAQPSDQRLELGLQPVAPDAPVAGEHLPLILISHGHGGSYAGHVDTAIALASAGYVVAALTHTGDNWRDASQATAIWERPRQLKLLDDYMLGAWPEHARIDPERIGAFGFSAGGFTVLAAAGGEADLSTVAGHCSEHPQFEVCRIAAAQPIHAGGPIAWVHDPRIRAVVSAAPAIGFAFGRDGLAKVTQPVQLWRAADDQVLPSPYYVEPVAQDLPQPPELHLVEHAGHYDFLSPCPEALAKQIPEICTSAPGFDRVAFHMDFDRAIVAFFDRTLRGR
jgi:predicted dienelactone hydrolase